MNLVQAMQRFTNLYLVWLIASVIIGLVHPPVFAWFKGQWIAAALTTVMLGMGFTLTIDDFKRLFKIPGSVAVGFIAQYTIMPLSGWAVARMLKLEPGFAIGLILVASCPGGTASNLITYLARANVALSVVLTMCSTLLAFIMTPLWCKTLAGQYVPVDALGLCISTLQVVVIPVVVGVLCNLKFPKTVERISMYGPFVSVIAILFITGGIVAQNAPAVMSNFGRLALAAVLLHFFGFGLGYLVCKVLRYSEDVARTVSIEVGMQNGGMAAVMAKKHFSSEPLSAVPAVFSAVTQNLVGSLLAAWWRRHPSPPEVIDQISGETTPTIPAPGKAP
ncbi:MAG TPA: bile acid:sodium symporter family protein [Roseimicrobium sp.]|nr:bile acid:sodium symporter family protein [Roseimicrobium sp.]